jgi:hypothetical protein
MNLDPALSWCRTALSDFNMSDCAFSILPRRSWFIRRPGDQLSFLSMVFMSQSALCVPASNLAQLLPTSLHNLHGFASRGLTFRHPYANPSSLLRPNLFVETSKPPTRDVCRLQQNLFGGLSIVPSATINVEFRRGDGAPLRTASIKVKGGEVETLPLYTNKDGITGEVWAQPYALPARGLAHCLFFCPREVGCIVCSLPTGGWIHCSIVPCHGRFGSIVCFAPNFMPSPWEVCAWKRWIHCLFPAHGRAGPHLFPAQGMTCSLDWSCC